MKPMEAYVKKWYDFLADGQIMGIRCKRCGTIEFPPIPVCNHCCSTDVEWVEVNREGQMVSLSANVMVDPLFAEYGQKIIALVRLADGPSFMSWLEGVALDEQGTLFDKLPVKVKMEVQKRDKYSFPVFRIAE
ncbi:MAG TPA: zinc ribbon domain-containing protein [Anaerolineaceae bacterium]|nr:zinc ribbon domain-containing protein [Anaerolineaceae bacterium]